MCNRYELGEHTADNTRMPLAFGVDAVGQADPRQIHERLTLALNHPFSKRYSS
jgi:hypothetical protein